ncbi:serine hydrolase [Mycobacterium kiyosense]|nr:hypothetical protein IWGMT90018_23750 [Mycobacterium kiyosense]
MIAVAATLVVAAAVVALGVVYLNRDAPTPHRTAAPPLPSTTRTAPPGQPDLASEFAQLAARLNATMGLAVAAVGSAEPPATWGSSEQGPAWSTSKVPLVIAAYREQGHITDKMRAAITESDNAAAEALWQQLGEPATAARKVQQSLQETGDPTTVQSRKVRPEYTAFGQTIWSLANQAHFTANAFCDKRNDPIFDLMAQIQQQQTWGIGTMAGARFKGGWGPLGIRHIPGPPARRDRHTGRENRRRHCRATDFGILRRRKARPRRSRHLADQPPRPAARRKVPGQRLDKPAPCRIIPTGGDDGVSGRSASRHDLRQIHDHRRPR